MNTLAELLSVRDIELDVQVADKLALLGLLAELLSARTQLPSARILQCLIERERLGSTALGHGIAFPHARIAGCSATAAVFVRTKAPIDFAAPDGTPVSQFLAIVVPRQATEKHLQILAAAATMFGDRSFRTAIKTCNDARELHELIAQQQT